MNGHNLAQMWCRSHGRPAAAVSADGRWHCQHSPGEERSLAPCNVVPANGLLERKVIAEEGDFVLVAEAWDGSAMDFPMCVLPRGTVVRDKVVKRNAPMYRAEAVKLGLIR